MMQVKADSLGKQFNHRWIFRQVSFSFQTGDIATVVGNNGSGKSTLLRIASGQLAPDEGKCQWQQDNKAVAAEDIYQLVSFTAPYINVPDELTLAELLSFYASFKPPALPLKEMPALAHLEKAARKPLSEFSSGMRQRAKLLLAFCFHAPLRLLDEPTSHLDTEGVEWYNQMLTRFRDNSITLIASNDSREYAQAGHFLSMADFRHVYP